MNAISLKPYNSFRLDSFVSSVLQPSNTKEFIDFLKQSESPIILGGGSNVVLASKITDDVFLTGDLNDITIDGASVYALCGAKTMLLAQKALDLSLSGLEFLIGIPGSVGGAVYMNASAHGQAVSDNLVYCDVYDREYDALIKMKKSSCGFGYRSSIFKNNGRYVILGAYFELKKAQYEDMKARIDENIKFRKEKQPGLALPNCGSVFKNPPDGSAGKLLDECGMKGVRIGGAQVWENHANFIINVDNANSTDISQLMFKMYNSVREKFGVELEPEILFVGEKNDLEREIWNILLKQK